MLINLEIKIIFWSRWRVLTKPSLDTGIYSGKFGPTLREEVLLQARLPTTQPSAGRWHVVVDTTQRVVQSSCTQQDTALVKVCPSLSKKGEVWRAKTSYIAKLNISNSVGKLMANVGMVITPFIISFTVVMSVCRLHSPLFIYFCTKYTHTWLYWDLRRHNSPARQDKMSSMATKHSLNKSLDSFNEDHVLERHKVDLHHSGTLRSSQQSSRWKYRGEKERWRYIENYLNRKHKRSNSSKSQRDCFYTD